MIIDPEKFQRLLEDFSLAELFNELGWDRAHRKPQRIEVGGAPYLLTELAQKRGVAVLLCSPDADGNVPSRAVMLKIEKEAAKLVHEHLLIFSDRSHSVLTWLWVSRVPGQPATTRTHTWRKGNSGEGLRQKLSQIVWSLEQEEAITLTDVVKGLKSAFDRDNVSRQFYDQFKREHDAFAGFIAGLNDGGGREWYASVMLNRLMFIYFVQRKGFLDGDPEYLRNRLTQVQRMAGEGKFHSFYRIFLRRLFHEGLGGVPADRDPGLVALIGDIPYLNGGLFDIHELEEANPEIDIPDDAFERLFDFFDRWDWHLDDRPLASGSEINPDVLGYIFEKYINQKQMGAYYTKEDVTEYIGKNTVLPHLLEQARERCEVAFAGDSSVWNLLRIDPERYIYPAIKTGVIDEDGALVPESALPDFVRAEMARRNVIGRDRRYGVGEAVFHTAAGKRGTLPTETWREYVDRRQRCIGLRERLASGAVRSADDFITFNLDIRQFMQDVIDTTTSPDLLRAVWHAIVGRVPEKSNETFRHGISILDPTCGSGAFLFAALNILEPLYEACLERMEGFVEDAAKLGRKPEADFVRVLKEVAKHPSRRYYIYKSIILHNLFGVDIMAEAVEICKLRLFLKLVSQVDRRQELEPLPDIDFNIRTGNSLVGYATEAQFDGVGSSVIWSDEQKSHKRKIKAELADLADLFDRFREQQTLHGGKVEPGDKRRLREKLTALSDELDRFLALDYDVDPDDAAKFARWQASHQPLHWMAEFYGVMRDGGFDVVIGNPPYVAKRAVKEYGVRGYKTAGCPDIYAWCLERVTQVGASGSRTGMIVPLSLAFSEDFDELRRMLFGGHRCNWFSHFSVRPSMLFHGVETRNTIHIGARSSGDPIDRTTRLHRWYPVARPTLFETIVYVEFDPEPWGQRIPKAPTQGIVDAFQQLLRRPGLVLGRAVSRTRTANGLRFRMTGRYWLAFAHEDAPAFDLAGNAVAQTQVGDVFFSDAEIRDIAFLLLNGKIEFAYWVIVGDDFHLAKWTFESLPVLLERLSSKERSELHAIVPKLQAAMRESVSFVNMAGKRIGGFNLARCRGVTDLSDEVFASAIGLSSVWDDIELLYVQTVRSDVEE